MDTVAVDNAHRTGRYVTVAGVRKPRHLIFRLMNYSDKHEIMRKKRDALKSENYFITDDMTKADLQKKGSLKPVIEEAERLKKKWKYRNGQLFIEDRLYREGSNTNDGRQRPPWPSAGGRGRGSRGSVVEGDQRGGGQAQHSQQQHNQRSANVNQGQAGARYQPGSGEREVQASDF